MATLANIVAAALMFSVSIETPEQIQTGWNDQGGKGPALGWAEWRSDRPLKNCIIHVPSLSFQTLYIWIHEIRHCRIGNFHRSE